MDTLATPQVPLSALGLEPQILAEQARSGKQPSLDAVAANFESVFLSMLLKEMRQTLEGGSFFGEDGSDIYGGLFDLYLGQHLAQGRGIGIATMVKRYLETARKS
jgi:Rod binding domain-containing protein